MKKTIAALFCLCLLLTGCVMTGPETTVPPVALSLTLQPITQRTTDDSGAEIFTLTYPKAIVTHPDSKVSQKISDDLDSLVARWTDGAAALEETAQQTWDDSVDQIPWYMSVEGTVTRMDDAVISLLFTYSEYSGGNHPIENTFSVNYNAKTGEVLKLSDILRKECPEYALVAQINRALAPSASELFDDYEAIVGNRFLEGRADNWYFSEKGLCFHFPPYDIGPYASGTIIAEMTYPQLRKILLDTYIRTE